MTTSEFDAAIPEEFWREVVDRVAREVPGTLLLAEAFWLMEGYFVRTLGMHRVYNSAFMVMLRDEDNANYRKVLKNTLEFDPGIMKRYVNFMSNPDERTAIDQFGSGDKFFGIATMMATLPGLPMFGHGQVEGFTEKYGMEYYRPRYDEWADDGLVARHNREIAPLLHERALFAESDNFLLYDCWGEHGGVEENVFAYSNQRDGAYGKRRALIAYNNSYTSTRGTLHHSAAYMDKGSGQLRQRSITDALALPTDRDAILAYRDNATGLTHLRRANEFNERGLHVELRGYGYAVLLDWRELRADATHAWDRLCDLLNGRGVEDLERALLALELEHVHYALRQALEPRLVREFATLAARTESTAVEDPALVPHSEVLEQWFDRAAAFIEQARAEYFKRVQPPPADEPKLAVEGAPEQVAAETVNEESLTSTRLRERVQALLRLPLAELQFAEAWSREARTVLPSASPLANAGSVWAPVVAYTLLAALGESLDMADPSVPALNAFDQFGLRSVLADAFAALEFAGQDTWRAAARVRLVLAVGVGPAEPEPTGKHAEELLSNAKAAKYGLAEALWQDGDLRWLIGIHEHEGMTYLNKESHEQLLWWFSLPDLLQISAQAPIDPQELETLSMQINEALQSAEKAGYAYASTKAEELLPANPVAVLAGEFAKHPDGLALESPVVPVQVVRESPLIHGDPEPKIAKKISQLRSADEEGALIQSGEGADPKEKVATGKIEKRGK